MQRFILALLGTLCVASGIALGCDRPGSQTKEQVPTIINDLDAFPKHVGQRVTVEGKADDYFKVGAYVIFKDHAVYMDRLKQWPADIRGNSVRVTGILEFHKAPEIP